MNKYLKMLSQRKINTLYSYLHDKSYKVELEKSIEATLFDYSIIVIWKTVMYFIYEKLYQFEKANQGKTKKKWEDFFEKKPKHYDPRNIFWPNTEEDTLIITFTGKLYPIDSNIVQLSRSAGQKRNTASHVASPKNTFRDVDGYLNEILKIVPSYQKEHQTLCLDKVNQFETSENILSHRFSNRDIAYFLQKLISGLKEVSHFEEADKYKYELANLKGYLNDEIIVSILKAIKENSPGHPYHQILESGSTATFIKKLYKTCPHPAEEWLDFANFLSERLEDKHALDSFKWLFDDLGFEKAENEELNIPF